MSVEEEKPPAAVITRVNVRVRVSTLHTDAIELRRGLIISRTLI